MRIPARKCAKLWPMRCGGLAGVVHAKRMKSFLRYVETGRARMDFQQLDESSGDVKYQKALSIVDSVVPLPKDLVWSLQ